ncbi:ABC transporter ATP-binding protein [Fluviispira sanaruensis]|uniref:Iron-enterobactin transporter ATP-binding protein n=1 Tax=Fluviispira sanaruensis TaxID=2493639 RepID=A0A4P2VM04_FLUSA|nr:ABC transporter ATP-binding protein [Fluviispira sanaruensis]BBH53034.1 iron-enterobactin transporter ATP-binding protein [Fluviispira sanaruensis]
MACISVQGLTAAYEKVKILQQIDLEFFQNKVTSIVGPNGSGKSTLLKTIAGSLKPESGTIHINNRLMQDFKKKELAKILAFLPQSPETPKDITVEQLVAYGRYSHQAIFKNTKYEDKKIIDWALSATNLMQMAQASISDLSGGQRQRAWIAMALAQNSDCLFLDEVTTYLDIRHQIEILNLLKKLNKKSAKTIIMVLHDINHALHYSDYIVVVKNGKIYAHESIESILENKVLESAFKVKFKVLYDENKKPFIVCNELIH